MFHSFDLEPGERDPYPESGPDKRILHFIVGVLIVIAIGCFAWAAFA